MSRKKQKRDAVPVEILAEGSGPIGEAAVPEVIEAAPAKRRGKKASEPDDVEVSVKAEAAAPEASEESPPPRRGKRARGRRAADDEARETSGEPVGAELEASEEVADPPGDGGEMEAAADDAAGEPMQDAHDAAMQDVADGEAMQDAADGEAMQDAADGEAMQDVADGEAMQAADDAAGEVVGHGDGEGDAGADGDDGEVTGDDAAAMPAAMDAVQLRHLVEALIFATDKPITLQRLRQLTRVSDVRRLEQALAELAEDYRGRGIALHQVSGGYQFRTNTQYSTWVQQLIAGRPVRLSRAQLETLAIVAYRQPITRPEIDEIRGVDSSATLRLLLDRALIRVLGKREEVGRPMLYGTTKEFLDFFSLGDLRELPTLREYSELTAESRQVMSDRLGVPLAPEDGAPEAEAAGASPGEDSFVSRAEAATEDVFVHDGRTDGEAASAMESALAGDAAGAEMFEAGAATNTTGDELASPDHDLVASLSESHASVEQGGADPAETMSGEAASADEPSMSSEAMSDESEISDESRSEAHEPLLAEHEPMMAEHEPLMAEHEPLMTEHEPLPAEHEPLMTEHEPLTTTGDEPGELEGSYPAAHRHLGDLDPDDDAAGDPMSDRAFDSGPADDDHVDEPGE